MAESCRKYFALALLSAVLLLSCTKEPIDPGVPEGVGANVTSVVHYIATVGEGQQTKASLNNLNQYIFETGDQLYVTSGVNLYGILNLVAGAGDPTGTFEGDLMCLNNFVPEDDTSLSATLVSRDDKIHTCADGKITGTAYPTSGVDAFATSFPEAVRYFSNFTATNTFSAHAFSLEQQSSFLVFSITFDDTEAGTITSSGSSTITATISNGGSTVRNGSVTAEEIDFSNQANFVAAFPASTVLSSATVSFTTTGNSPTAIGSGDTINDATLSANRYYEISRSHVNLDYFTIQAKEDNTDITFNYTGTIEYRVNPSSNSDPWNTYSSTVNLQHQKDYVQFRSKRAAYNTDGTPVFTATNPVYIYGNIMSLMCDNSWNPKTAVANYGFRYAFRNVTNIDIPAGRPLRLTATSLGTSCYAQMFQGCTSLTRAPELPATTIPNYAYSYMFSGCTSLVSAPDLPATNVGEGGYQYMFSGCTALITVPATIAGTSATKACQYMFQGCTTLANAPALPSSSVGSLGYYRMFKGCTGLMQAPDLPAETLGTQCYQEMFMNCSSLVSAPAELPATTLAASCYQDMFNGCLALSKAPAELPATYSDSDSPSSCYKGMFNNCISLNHAPEIKLERIGANSCELMFNSCTSLVTAEGLENVTSVGASGCLKMFYNCGELTTTPSVLKPTSLPESAYSQMYYGCAKITAAPDIKATSTSTTSCYGMFYSCRRLRTAPPKLAVTAVAKQAFKEMFRGCSSLASAPEFTGMTEVGEEGCMNMFYGCTNLKAAPELPAMTLVKLAYKGMFQGSGITTVPALLVTSLTESCYESMFQNCKYLEGPAVLPAEILATNCYKNMFNGSPLLNSVVCLATTNISTANCADWLKNVSATGTFVKPSGVSDWATNSASGIPTGWTVQDSGLDPIFPDDGAFDPEEDL